MLSNCGAGADSCKSLEQQGDQTWILFGRADAIAEALIFWPPDANTWLIAKDPDAGKEWRQKEKRATEDKMVGWHHQFNGREPGQTPGWWGTGMPGVLQSVGSSRAGHDLATEQQQQPVAQTVKNLPATQETQVWPLGEKISRRRERQPTPVFLPEEFHGQISLVGYSPKSRTEYLTLSLFFTYWRRQWHPTPVLLPGKSHGWRSLVSCSPWGR